MAVIMYLGVRAFGWYFYKKAKKMEEKQRKELEDIIDTCIIETVETEDNLKKDFEDFKQMETAPIDKMKEYLELQKSMNLNRSEVLTNRDLSMRSEARILEVAEKNNKVIVNVDNKFNKVIYALFIIFFLLGVFAGMIDDVWKPYVSDILSFTRASTNIIKG